MFSIIEFINYSRRFENIIFDSYILHKSDVFYLEYKGEYEKISQWFQNFNILLNRYHLDRKNWNLFGFYYDDPNILDSDKCKACTGLIYNNEKNYPENILLNIEISSELIRNEKFEYASIQETELLVAKYSNTNFLPQPYSIIKFYQNLKTKMQYFNFLKKFS